MNTKQSKISILLILLLSINFCNAQSGGDSLFNETVHTIRINFSQNNYFSILQANKAIDDANDTNTYIPAQVIVDGRILDSVGIQFKGNSSYYNYPGNKKPFTLSFDEYKSNQNLDGLKSLNLNNFYQDPTFMREKMFLDIANSKGLYAPRANYAKVYLNNQYWGLYLMCERIKKKFLTGRFSNTNGNLFKGDRGTSACANLKYYSALNSYYNCYELTNNEKQNNWTDLVKLTNAINNSNDTTFKVSLDSVLNTNSFIGAWALYNLLCNFDSYPYRFTHNYYLYNNTKTKQFEWIIWDVSTAFGLDIPGTTSSIENQSVLYITPNINDRPLVKRMLENKAFKDKYLNTICNYANTDFKSNILNARIDTLKNRIKNDVYADNLKMYSNANFDNNIENNITVGNGNVIGLKSFIKNRSLAVANELKTLGYENCTSLSVKNMQEFNTINIYPNPASHNFSLMSKQSLKGAKLSLYDVNGKLCQLQILNNDFENNITINSNLTQGMYIAHLLKDNYIQYFKIYVSEN